jgi:tripartite-type tricarboxylate transporter receptor subunit TctC
VHINIAPVPQLLSLIQEGKIRPLAYTGPQRSPDLPDVPTMTEQGTPVEVGAFFGMLGPAGISPQAVAWLNREANKVFSVQDTRDRFVKQGAAMPLGTPEDFARHIAAESARYGEVIRKAGIKLE